jgi:tartrate dehydrogenase/decarboxylase/D-malate dehydrogenase
MKSYDIGLIPGDGIGPEVVAEGVKVLRVLMRMKASIVIWWNIPIQGSII